MVSYCISLLYIFLLGNGETMTGGSYMFTGLVKGGCHFWWPTRWRSSSAEGGSIESAEGNSKKPIAIGNLLPKIAHSWGCPMTLGSDLPESAWIYIYIYTIHICIYIYIHQGDQAIIVVSSQNPQGTISWDWIQVFCFCSGLSGSPTIMGLVLYPVKGNPCSSGKITNSSLQL